MYKQFNSTFKTTNKIAMILKKYSSLFFLAVIILFFLNVSQSKALAEQNKFVTTCKINKTNVSCFNLHLNENPKIHLLSAPNRVQFVFQKKIIIKKDLDYNTEFIKSIRFNEGSVSGTKLVIEFKNPTIISDIKYYEINSQTYNLTMYFSNTSEVNFVIAKHILNKNNGNIFSLENNVKVTSNKVHNKSNIDKLPTSKQQSFKKIKTKKNYIVFIDPGHGGRDPGAIGQLGTLEKNVTLKASILLAKELKKSENVIPILSRQKDVYLSLKQRTKLAKKNKADIFISIHADSSKNKKAKGISVFSLSDKASDKEAQMLAQRENQVDNFLGNKETIVDPLIYGTLIKMFQREAMNDSSFLAKNILLNLEKTKLALNRGHRFAGFLVLKSYDIPSVLIEIGFLSNKQEEKKLLNPKYLNGISKGLAIAIKDYFSKFEK